MLQSKGVVGLPHGALKMPLWGEILNHFWGIGKKTLRHYDMSRIKKLAMDSNHETARGMQGNWFWTLCHEH